MKNIKELGTYLNKLSMERNEAIQDCRVKLQKAEEAVKCANADLLSSENENDLTSYGIAKDKLWSATNAKEFYSKQLNKLENTPIVSEQEKQDLYSDLSEYLAEANRKQYKVASSLMTSLNDLSNQSLELFNECEGLFELLGYSLPKTDFVSGFNQQVMNTPMYNLIMKGGN